MSERSTERSRSFASPIALLFAAMMLAPLLALAPYISSDPVDTDNVDYTRTVAWDMDTPGDYSLSGMIVADGEASLAMVNESKTEDSAEDYASGTQANLDTDYVPGSIILDETSSFTTTVTLQPDAAAGEDSYISEESTTVNYGAERSLRIDSETDKAYRMLLRFNFTGVPSGAYINDATLDLYLTPGAKGDDIVYGIHALNTSFDEHEVTWNRATISKPWDTPGGDFSSAPYSVGVIDSQANWKSFVITNLVEGWIRETIANNGMIFVPEEGADDSLKEFYSSDETSWTTNTPKLTINYTVQGNEGAYESAPLGPGTNSTFTSMNWSNGTVSFASDEFSESPLSPEWLWLNNPLTQGGSYNVGVTLPGWLYVVGSPNSVNVDTSVEANYMYQKVTGDFEATLSLMEYFTVDYMDAGILVMENEASWLSIAKADDDANGKIEVVLCQDGVSGVVATLPWPDLATAHLKIVRNSTGFWLSAGTDGQSWTDVHHHEPPVAMALKVMVGLFVASDSGAQPNVAFDFLRIEPLAEPVFQIMVRTGNSTSLSDPSWTDWSSPLVEGEPLPNVICKYFRYRVYLSCLKEWYTPCFSGMTAHWERFSPTGSIETADYLAPDFSSWLSFSADHNDSQGRVNYSFSTDGGATWNYITSGAYSPMASLEPSIRVRADVMAYDTLATPTISSIRLTYGTALSTFYIEAPSVVTVGDEFPVEIWAKNSENKTTTQLTGAISLHAMDSMGLHDASDELQVTSWLIASAGHALISSQRYLTAETITIQVRQDNVTGLSAPITFLPGPMAAVHILPYDADSILEGTTMTLEGLATDVYGNEVPDAEFSWTITEGLGELSSTTGSSVVFYPAEAHSTGYINISSGGFTESRFFTVECIGHPPVFVSAIPDQAAVEDGPTWTYDLDPHVYDAGDGIEDLRWYVTGESLVTASNENKTGHMTLTLTPKPDLYGHDVLDLFVVDSEGESAWTQVVVDIEPVNDAPTISEIKPLVVDFDSPYVYNLRYYIADVDNDLEELSLSIDDASSQYVTVDAERLSLVMEYPEELIDTTQGVVVTVSDGELSSSTPISVTVAEDDVPVLLRSLPAIIMMQGDALINVFDLDEYFMDTDDEELHYTAGQAHVVIDINEDNEVSVYAPMDWSGEEYVVFSAADPRGARAEDAVAMTVLPVNQPPWIAGLPDLQVRYDKVFEFDTSPYIGDVGGDIASLTISTDDSHIAVLDKVLSMMYPQTMQGMTVKVNITVSDGELVDVWVINVTVTDNNPPESLGPPDHTFPEDWPQDYSNSSGLGLDEWFHDEEDGDDLEYEVFSWSDNVTANLSEASPGTWIVTFSPDQDFHGETRLTIRAVDAEGAIVEDTIAVRITSTPDAPVFDIVGTFTVAVATDVTYDLRQYIADVDSDSSQLRITVSADHKEYVTATSTLVMMHFPEDYLSPGESSRQVMVELRVIDQDGLWDTSIMQVTVISPSADGPLGSLAVFLLLLAAGVSLGLFGMVLSNRKKPFVVKDMMLVHEDGFLINRHVDTGDGELDKDIFTGMLTAVLNFVEDSMSSTQEHLKFFGFEHYRVMVTRGEKVYAAIVFEGDRPKGIENHLAEFLAKVEKIYRKSLENWTGDIEVDFAGVELLIKGFVDEHGKKGRRRNGDPENGRLRAKGRTEEEDGSAPDETEVDAPSDDDATTAASESR